MNTTTGEGAAVLAKLLAERNELITQLTATQRELADLRGELTWVYHRLAAVLEQRQQEDGE